MKNKLHYMLETPKTLSTHHNYGSKNLKDATMGNQQETKKNYKYTNKKNKKYSKQLIISIII